MARPSALLLAAAVLVVAVCGQYTAQAAFANPAAREIPVFVPVAGSAVDWANYTRLLQFCNLAKTNTTAGILVCEIFSVTPASVANSVDVGAYFVTSADTTPTAVASIINAAFPEGTNVGGTGIIRTAVARAGTPKNVASTPATGDSPARFTALRMRLRIFYRGQQTAAPTTTLKAADLVTKLTATELILSVTLDTTGSVDTDVTVDNGTLHMAEVNVQGYYEDRRTMMDAIRTVLQNATTPGQFVIVEMIDVTHVSTPENAVGTLQLIVGYDALSADGNNQAPYKLTISFTTALDATAASAASTNALRNAIFDAVYPLTQFSVTTAAATAGSPASTSVLPITFSVVSSADVVRLLQFFRDAIVSGNTTRTTFGTVTFTGISSFTTVSRGDVETRGDSFRIPTTDFPLQQRYRFGLDVLQSFLNVTFAPNEVCAQVLRRTAGVTACFIERITTGAPTANNNSLAFTPASINNGTALGKRRSQTTLVADGQVFIVLNASDVLSALQMKFNVQNSLRAGVVATTNLTLNFSDPSGPNSAVVVREELWGPRQQRQTTFINLNAATPATGTATGISVIASVDDFQKRTDFSILPATGSAGLIFNPFRIGAATYSRLETRYYIGKTDITPAIAPATGLNYRIWAVGPKVVTRTALRLEILVRAADSLATVNPNGAITIAGNSTGFGEAFAVTPTILVVVPSGIVYSDASTASSRGTLSTQTNLEDAAAALFTGQASTVFDAPLAVQAVVNTVTQADAPVKYFALTPAPIVSIVAQQFTVFNASRPNIGTFVTRSPVVSSTVLQPELAASAFPAAPAVVPAPAPPGVPAVPATGVVPVSAPAAPVAPSAITPGSIQGFRVGIDFFIVTPPAVNATELCAAIVREGARFGILSCRVIDINVNAVLPTQGAKFQQQAITRVVTEIVVDSSTNANALINNLIAAINSRTFLRGFNVADVNLVTLSAVPAPGTAQPTISGPAAPGATNTTGAFTTVDIFIVILGTALDSAAQSALNNECGTILGGGATCTTRSVEQTTAARKLTTQASALRLTETVRAPAATYPNVNTIIARLQQGVRDNNGRLGGQQVASISTINNGSPGAAGRTTPALLVLLAAALVAVLGAMAQF